MKTQCEICSAALNYDPAMTEVGLCYRCAVDEYVAMKKERDAAQKACAEMRHAIQVLVSGLHYKALNDPAVCKMVDCALSSDCGKHYIHKRELEPLVEALRRVIDGKVDDAKNSNGLSAGEISVGDLQACVKALAHAERLKGETK